MDEVIPEWLRNLMFSAKKKEVRYPEEEESFGYEESDWDDFQEWMEAF